MFSHIDQVVQNFKEMVENNGLISFRYQKDWTTIQNFLERCEQATGPEDQLLSADKSKLQSDLQEAQVIKHRHC